MTDPAPLVAQSLVVQSLVVQAFAGSDLARLAWTSALGSLLVSGRVRPWQVALLVFGLDRALPFWGMAEQYEPGVILAAFFGALAALPGDLPALLLRYGGVLAVVHGLWRARLALHGRRPVTKAEPGAA